MIGLMWTKWPRNIIEKMFPDDESGLLRRIMKLKLYNQNLFQWIEIYFDFISKK